MNPKTGIAAIVLAAGSSSRMGGQDKLMMKIGGETLLYRTVKNICASAVSKCIIVVRNDVDKYRAMLEDFDVEIVLAANAYEGMSVSLKAGMNAAGEYLNGYMICLGDMPDLLPHHFNQVIAAHRDDKIIRPRTIDGRYGHPVLFAQCYYDKLKKMSGDVGARSLIKEQCSNVIELEMDDAILTDLDTLRAWSDWVDKSNSER